MSVKLKMPVGVTMVQLELEVRLALQASGERIVATNEQLL